MEKIGLVLGGGGAKGAYQLGVWQAICFLGFSDKISAFSGASIGALNGVLFGTSTIEKSEKIWELSKVKPFNKDNLKSKDKALYHVLGDEKYRAMDNIKRNAFLSSKKLEHLIIDNLNFEDVVKSDKEFYVVCSNKEKPVYYDLKKLTCADDFNKIVQATASIPHLFKPVKYHDLTLTDGGITDNVPIKPLLEEGYNNIIVIKLNKNAFDYSALEKSYPSLNVVVIEPKEDLGNFINGTINFYDEKIDESVKKGYQDGLAVLGDYFIALKHKYESVT